MSTQPTPMEVRALDPFGRSSPPSLPPRLDGHSDLGDLSDHPPSRQQKSEPRPAARYFPSRPLALRGGWLAQSSLESAQKTRKALAEEPVVSLEPWNPPRQDRKEDEDEDADAE